MTNLQILTEEKPAESINENQIPLLTSNSNHENEDEANNKTDTEVDKTLARLELFLNILGFNPRSVLYSVICWTVFFALGVAVPLTALWMCDCSECEKYELRGCEMVIVAFQASLAAVSLLCLSHCMRKYGLRRFLFVDRYTGDVACFHRDYVNQISGSLRLFILWVFPCFLLKTAREISRISYIQHGSWGFSIMIFIALIVSWTYVSAISLSACILFHLVCNLQVVHFDDYGKLLERESDVLVFLEEHMRLRYHLSKISHRFRIYLLLEFLVVTVSQVLTLLQVTGYRDRITIVNGGDFAVSTLVQVVGIIICLHAATRISHRAQGVVSLASRWHAIATCTSSDTSQMRSSASAGSLEVANHLNSIQIDYSESDLESLDFGGMAINTQLVSCMSSHHKRQAFVMYLQSNPGGITIFGWTVDRSLLNTIFFLELSLVTFVLGQALITS
ncbi:uncharacterized protein LOC127107246 [Lathyrus oleraceus]|uniref:Uncharacterized protein n=1 Tax=Pisum sativum TaxID=3888 RepID=A0A9D4VM29_PEA|nr:uncharacterized protein LOC127107246 [Pisum sativum]KAI5385216.1 hypothetical protein KIW84_071991 [Pisum sativum]